MFWIFRILKWRKIGLSLTFVPGVNRINVSPNLRNFLCVCDIFHFRTGNAGPACLLYWHPIIYSAIEYFKYWRFQWFHYFMFLMMKISYFARLSRMIIINEPWPRNSIYIISYIKNNRHHPFQPITIILNRLV